MFFVSHPGLSLPESALLRSPWALRVSEGGEGWGGGAGAESSVAEQQGELWEVV